MKREKCALCGRYYPIPGTVAATDECPGLSCWTDAIKRLAEVGLTPSNLEKETPMEHSDQQCSSPETLCDDCLHYGAQDGA